MSRPPHPPQLWAGALGFLADARRLNVAFTRAKSKLVIVGCGDTLRASPVLEQVMGVVIKHDWIVEVPRNYAGRGR